MQIFLARALLLLTPCLMILGGFVHSIGASLACPDWPLCHDELFPEMTGGILYEHSHRLLAGLIGLLTLALWASTYRRATVINPWRAALGVALICWQGLLGGLTVLLRLPAIVSIMHLTSSLLFLAWVVYINLSMQHTVEQSGPLRQQLRPLAAPRGLLRLLQWATALLLVQMILGAVVRHMGASLACGLQAVACADGYVPTTWRGWLQTSHRLQAVVTLVVVAMASAKAVAWARKQHLLGAKTLGRWLRILHAGLLLQILLGAWTLWSGVHPHVVTMHLLLGIVLWIGQLIIWQQCAWFGLQVSQPGTA